jgi:hypothetical protein
MQGDLPSYWSKNISQIRYSVQDTLLRREDSASIITLGYTCYSLVSSSNSALKRA